jgi:hypothetical protein
MTQVILLLLKIEQYILIMSNNNANKQNFNPSQSVRGIEVDFSQLNLADIFPNFKYEVGGAIPAKEFNESLGIMVDTVIFENDIIRLT